MSWSALMLLFVALYAGFKCLGIGREQENLKFLGLTMASFLFALTETSILIDSLIEGSNSLYANQIVEWTHILILSFVLSSLAIFIRQSKPVFAQFPLVYAGLPFLIVISYFLVKDTYALKEWLMSIYQGGAILVGLLMYSVYTYREQRHWIILAGMILFTITFITYWYVPNVQQTYAWIWEALLGCSTLTVVYGYDYALKQGAVKENDYQGHPSESDVLLDRS